MTTSWEGQDIPFDSQVRFASEGHRSTYERVARYAAEMFGDAAQAHPRRPLIFVQHGSARKYPEELLERGVRLALESDRPIAHVADDLGIHRETLRKRVRQAEADQGLRPDLPTSEEREEIKRLRQENFELRRANEILKSASVFFPKELDPDRPR